MGKKAAAPCDSPLERGRGVCYPAYWRTHPRHDTVRRTPSQEGSCDGDSVEGEGSEFIIQLPIS